MQCGEIQFFQLALSKLNFSVGLPLPEKKRVILAQSGNSYLTCQLKRVSLEWKYKDAIALREWFPDRM